MCHRQGQLLSYCCTARTGRLWAELHKSCAYYMDHNGVGMEFNRGNASGVTRYHVKAAPLGTTAFSFCVTFGRTLTHRVSNQQLMRTWTRGYWCGQRQFCCKKKKRIIAVCGIVGSEEASALSLSAPLPVDCI